MYKNVLEIYDALISLLQFNEIINALKYINDLHWRLYEPYAHIDYYIIYPHPESTICGKGFPLLCGDTPAMFAMYSYATVISDDWKYRKCFLHFDKYKMAFL